MNDIATEVREIGANIVKEHWRASSYDLDCDPDCRSCRDKDVCDDMRKIIAARIRNERVATGSPLPPGEGQGEGNSTAQGEIHV